MPSIWLLESEIVVCEYMCQRCFQDEVGVPATGTVEIYVSNFAQATAWMWLNRLWGKMCKVKAATQILKLDWEVPSLLDERSRGA